MISNRIYKYFPIFLILFLVGTDIIMAQTEEKDDKKQLKDEDIIIVREYKPKLADAIKLSIIPVNEKPNLKKPALNYSIDPKKFATAVNQKKIRSVSLKPKGKKEKLNNLMVKAGIGNYSGILADIDYSATKFRDRIFSANARHYSGRADADNSNFSEQQLTLSGKRFYRKRTLGGKFYLSNNAYHYYGDSINIETDKNTIKQNYFDIGLLASFNNLLDKKANIHYGIDADVYHFSDHYDSKELGIRLDGFLEQEFNGYPINIGIGYRLYSYDTNSTINNSIFRIAPKYKWAASFANVDIGFRIVSENLNSDSKFHFYPDISLESPIFEKNLVLFGGMTGDLSENSYKGFAESNPFIRSDIELKNTNNKFELFGGIKGNLYRSVDYAFKLSFKNLDNLYYFINDSSDMKKFFILYDSATVTQLTLHGELMATPVDNLKLFIGANIHNYSSSTAEYPWHLPAYDIKITGRYDLGKKIYFGIDAFILGDTKTIDIRDPNDIKVIDLGQTYDLNASFSYKFSKKFTVFFQFNNIVGEYSNWYNYNVRGFHILGGAVLNI